MGSWPEPWEAFFGADLGDPGAVERSVGGLESLGDLVGGVALAAELDDTSSGGLLGGAGLGSGAGEQEEVAVA